MTALPRSRPKKPSTLWGDLLGVFLFSPLWAIPFGVLFGMLYGKTPGDYLSAYIGSLIFAVMVNLFIWATEWFVRPVVLPDVPNAPPSRMILRTMLFGGAATLGSIVTAIGLHFTIAPSILGSPRQAAVVGAFTLLFVVLIAGGVLMTKLYRESLARVRSDQELTLARRIQSSFLPSTFPELQRLEVHAINVPSRHVSGDFYDVVPGGESDVWIAVADVSGKGVPAALLSSMLQASLRTQAEDGGSVSGVMGRINRLAWRSTTPEQFATFFLARLELRSPRLTYCNAGHNPPMLFRRGARTRLLDQGGTVVGILESAPYAEETLDLATGDLAVIYTDGITEAVDANGEMFGEERLEAAVARLALGLEASEVTRQLLDAVRAFLDGVEPGDDMTVMALRVL